MVSLGKVVYGGEGEFNFPVLRQLNRCCCILHCLKKLLWNLEWQHLKAPCHFSGHLHQSFKLLIHSLPPNCFICWSILINHGASTHFHQSMLKYSNAVVWGGTDSKTVDEFCSSTNVDSIFENFPCLWIAQSVDTLILTAWNLSPSFSLCMHVSRAIP